MFKILRRILCACMLMLILLPAQAEVTYAKSKVYIISNTLNAYQKASTSSKVLGVMSYGENMTMLAFSGGWVRIRNAKGQIGYCKLSGLSTLNPNNLDETVYAKDANTPVYQKPGASYKKIAHVKQNAELNVVAMTGNEKWLRVKNGSKYGYVSVDDVSREPVSTTSYAKKVYIVSENASTVYSGKGGGKNLGSISHGQSYTLLSTSGKYARVKNSKGQIGYCLAELLSTENPNNMNATMYAQVSGNMLYTNSLLKGEGKYLKKGAKVTAVAETPEGGWYRVKYGGKFYYVKSILLNDEPAPDGGREVYASSDNTKVYAKASFSSKKLTTVNSNDTLRLVGMNKQGAKVKTESGVTGYIPIGLLEPYTWTFTVRKN